MDSNGFLICAVFRDPLPLINFALNNMKRTRTILGGRTPIEVMTGQAPDTPVELVLWMGQKLKDATSVVTRLELVQQHCATLATLLDNMHEELRDAELIRQRKKAAKESRDKFKGALAFNEGDLVMVAAQDNSANPKRKAKPMVTWQGGNKRCPH